MCALFSFALHSLTSLLSALAQAELARASHYLPALFRQLPACLRICRLAENCCNLQQTVVRKVSAQAERQQVVSRQAVRLEEEARTKDLRKRTWPRALDRRQRLTSGAMLLEIVVGPPLSPAQLGGQLAGQHNGLAEKARARASEEKTSIAALH